jgi:hypothetical protein
MGVNMKKAIIFTASGLRSYLDEGSLEPIAILWIPNGVKSVPDKDVRALINAAGAAGRLAWREDGVNLNLAHLTDLLVVNGFESVYGIAQNAAEAATQIRVTNPDVTFYW